MKRTTWEIYAEIINLCPMMYTRLIRASGVNTRRISKCFDLGLIEKRVSEGKDNNTYRKSVYVVHSTEKGRLFESFLRSIQEILKT